MKMNAQADVYEDQGMLLYLYIRTLQTAGLIYIVYCIGIGIYIEKIDLKYHIFTCSSITNIYVL